MECREGRGRDELLSIGRMAELCGVSRKALRLYHEKGLLSPGLLDEANGYRYYSFEQIPDVDRIFRLQNLGFSLKDIKTIIGGPGLKEFVGLYERRLGEIDDEIVRLEVARSALLGFLQNQCSGDRYLLDGKMALEWKPERRVASGDLGGMSITLSSVYHEEGAQTWYQVIAMVKRALRERGVPDVAMNEISTMIRKEDLLNRNMAVTRAGVLLDGVTGARVENCEIIKAGYWLVSYANSFYRDDGAYSEGCAIRDMLDFIEERGLDIRGDYLGQGNVDEPLRLVEDRCDYLRFEIPVAL